MLGIGLDVVELDRFRRTLERTPAFGRRVFTAAEVEYAQRRRDPTERYAVRFAAKEAVLKAMGVGLWSCPLTEIEVVKAESGEPSVVLHGAAAELARGRGIESWRLTLTHTDVAAHAIAVAFGLAGPSLRVRLLASDRSSSVAFYEDALGFRCVGWVGDVVVLAAGSSIIEVVPAPAGAQAAASQVELVLVVDDVRGARQRAERHVPGLGSVRVDDGAPGFTLADPDGNPIRVLGCE